MGRKKVGREIQGRNPGYPRALEFGEDEEELILNHREDNLVLVM